MNNALKDVVEQPVHELGSMPCGCAPDPPVSTARSTVLIIRTSVLLDQNRWPAWMRDEPEIDPKSEDANKFSPKLLWSDLVQNEEELRNSVLQWYGMPNTNVQRREGKVEGPHSEHMINKLKEAGLVEQLDSAEAVIRQQQAIIESLKRQRNREPSKPHSAKNQLLCG